MGYLFLSISIFAGLTKGFCGKKISGYVEGYKDAMMTNFIRMMLCIVIGFLMVTIQEGIASLKVDIQTLLISVLSGVTTSAFVVLWVISVKTGAYMMLDVFLMLGVLVTMAGCKIFLNEPIRINQYAGFAFLVVAALIMCSYNSSVKGKMTLKGLILLIGCGLANGLTDFSQKLFVNYSPNISVATFNFYTYIFSAITLLVFFFFFSAKEKDVPKKDSNMLKEIFIFILIMSVCLFASSYFKTLAASLLSSAQLYPLSQGSSLILSALMASIFFKEKITFKCTLGMCIAFVGLLIMNLL